MNNKTYKNRDLQHIWHPCTQMKDHETLPMIPIKRGDGIYLEDFDGNRYLDAISSWWVNLFGHCHPYINQAIKNQLDTLEHVIFAGFTHESIITLSERLLAITPIGLNRCFYAETGSAAIEIAIKMSFHYWLNKGKPNKKKFITLANGYHGETLGALAVGNVELYKKTYGPLLMDTITVPSPDCFHREFGETCAHYSERMFVHMQQALEQHADQSCAVIVEPLVQCAGNMRMYDPIYLSLLRDACDHYNVHLIADEIAVGFGRSGTMFACEQAAITPDFMCLSKGLTGGYLPLSVTITTDNVYDAFYDDYQNQTAFLHSHSYTGNPLACSAALATLDLFERHNTVQQNTLLSQHFAKTCATLSDHPHVAELRQTGMILAIEMVKHKASKTAYPWQQRRGLRVYQYALKKGVLLRPLADVVYFMPPYTISVDQINHMVQVATDAIDFATQD